jgi:hypothetical protein
MKGNRPPESKRPHKSQFLAKMNGESLNEDKQIHRGADHSLPGRRLQSNRPGGAILRQAEGGTAPRPEPENILVNSKTAPR